MRDKKRCLAQFTFYDRTGIEAYLEKMALKGWLLEKMTTYYWQFRRIEPQKIHFAVTYFPKGSEFDPEPSEEQKMLFAFCERAGWKFIDTTAQIQIFYNEAEEPVPIETDALVELENIHESVKKNFLIAQGALLACAGLQIGILISDWVRDPLYILTSNAKLFGAVCWISVVIMCITEVIGYFLWYRKAKKAAETDGSFVRTKGNRRFQLILLAIVLVVFVVYVGSLGGVYRFAVLAGMGWMIGLIVLVNLIKNVLKRMKVSTDVTRAITFVSSFVLSFGLMGIAAVLTFRAFDAGWFEREPVSTYEHKGVIRNIYHDELPLTVENLQETDYAYYSYELEETSTIFIKKRECTQRAKIEDREPELDYTIYDVKLPMLYDFCLEAIKNEFLRWDRDGTQGLYLKELDGNDWGAEQVFQYYSSGYPMTRYLLCFEGRLAVVKPDWEPTQEQMVLIGEKLRK